MFLFQVIQIVRIGGADLRRGVSAAMNRVMTMDAMCGFNMYGRGKDGKSGFTTTALYSVMRGKFI